MSDFKKILRILLPVTIFIILGYINFENVQLAFQST